MEAIRMVFSACLRNTWEIINVSQTREDALTGLEYDVFAKHMKNTKKHVFRKHVRMPLEHDVFAKHMKNSVYTRRCPLEHDMFAKHMKNSLKRVFHKHAKMLLQYDVFAKHEK